MRRLGSAVVMVLLALSGWAAPVAADDYPAPQGPITDAAGVLRPDTVARLRQEVTDFEARTGDEVAVAVIQTTGSQSASDYARNLFNRWGVGKAAADNGVLLLVAVKDHHLWITPGDGLKGKLTDGVTASIIDDQIVPRFKAGDIDGGIEAGVIALRGTLGDTAGPAGSPPASPVQQPAPFVQNRPVPSPISPSRSRGPEVFFPLFFVIVLVIIVASIITGGGRGRGRRGFGGTGMWMWGSGWGGRRRGGGFFNSGGGFGGGSFGGGGGGSFGGGGFSGGSFGGGSSSGGGAGGSW